MTDLLGAIKAKCYWKHNVKDSHFVKVLDRNNSLVMEKQKIIAPWLQMIQTKLLEDPNI